MIFCICFIHSQIFYELSRRERRKLLDFTCICEACENNYPLFDELPWSPIAIPRNILETDPMMGIPPRTRKKAKKLFRTVVSHLQKIDHLRPTKDWSIFMQAFSRCAATMYEKENLDFLYRTDSYIKFRKV